MPSGFMDAKPWPVASGFDEIKSAQVAAYLVQAVGEPTDKLKLIKLIYLSEREYLNRYLLPMTLDEFYSLKDGPIASCALNGLNGQLDQALWSEWIERNQNKITPHEKRTRDDFDNLSDADIQVLDAVISEFGSWTTPEIWNYVHTKCPEYQEVTTGRLPIDYADILKALEKDNAEKIDQNIRMLRREAAFT